MSGFIGQYEYQMDPKGRVSVPAAFRRGEEGGHFVLIKWEKDCLTLFPPAKWKELQEEMLRFRKGNPQEKNKLRRMLARAAEVSPDKQGRILVPSALQEAVGLSGAVLMVGQLDRVEIWDPQRYADEVESDDDDLGAFAHQLFG